MHLHVYVGLRQILLLADSLLRLKRLLSLFYEKVLLLFLRVLLFGHGDVF